ncbi:VapC toxin family PIN domain ribonuclease [Rhizobium sp. JAB6]|uniref:TA system VapC family ribonuclease toxin n=1 Tax=Rhizobium sp. JAB6 TaxID=2127050 RepID=UPI000D11AC74|nr:TA system VapC family ribonuclease toxin [Rhizobium sp. JAB6]PST18968.1 VapC toxin family PIN domain ribonuclease [Rhizobium sp. JAB6]
MTFLLDINVLIALFDPSHVAHDIAHDWFHSLGSDSWATCPLTENGVVRILSQSNYPNSPGPPSAVALLVSQLRGLPGHQFWADDVSLLDESLVDSTRLLTPGQITDTYLLALAKFHNGQLATLDRRLSAAAVKNGKAALHIIAGNQ